MDEREIKQLISSEKSNTNRRGWRCPDENQLAAYVSGKSKAEKRPSLESHLADCKYCLQSLAFLARDFEEPQFDSVPAHLPLLARALANKQSAQAWRWRWATAAATACLLIVAGVFLWRVRVHQNPTAPTDLVAQEQPNRGVEQVPVNPPAPRPESTQQ